MLSQVPGIIEAWTTITPNPDGSVSFGVLIGPACDLIELIIRPEHINCALVTGGSEKDQEAPTFPCHIGFSQRTAI